MHTLKPLMCLIVLAMLRLNALAGQPGIDTDEIESLIDEWNYANNLRNIHGFEKVYADQLTYYGADISKRSAISRKRQLFREKPWFRQRIITEITFTTLPGGAVRCSFLREVYDGKDWRKQPSHLLVSYNGGRYSIVGENDIAPNRAKKMREPTPDPIAARTRDNVDTSLTRPIKHADSLEKVFTTERERAVDSSRTEISLAQIDALFTDFSSLGVVTIQRGYIFALIGILALGGLMIFIADSVHSQRRRKRLKIDRIHSEVEHVVRDFRVQGAFEDFVITLFDPLYFKPFRPKTEYVYAGMQVQGEKGPDLIFDYRQKETHMRFAITCQYYQHAARKEVQLLSHARQDAIRNFAADREMNVYYVLGFGGRPDDPRELFFIPASEVSGEYITRAQLKQYSKSGMFYYNQRTGRIQ